MPAETTLSLVLNKVLAVRVRGGDQRVRLASTDIHGWGEQWVKVRDCIFTMTACRLGLALVVEEGLLEGIITDGDLRRALLQDPDMMDKRVSEFMNPDPVTSSANRMLTEAEAVMRENKIRALVVLGERRQPKVQDDICGLLEIFY